MGSGSWTTASYLSYSEDAGKTYCATTGRVTNQVFYQNKLDKSLDPKLFSVRECVNNEEHPNTIPIILGLDVTGSMGATCKECAEALGVIMTSLYKKYKDVEFCIMGIGDLAYDDAPIQMSQFESDVRIAESLDKVYMEHGGGGNSYESYTAAWYMGLKRTKLDAVDKQGRKGIIITMGDEELNPYLPFEKLNNATNSKEQADVKTNELYEEVSKKFDVFHIAVNDSGNCYDYHKKGIDETFGDLLGKRLKISTINKLSETIESCIDDSLQSNPCVSEEPSQVQINENGEISW